MAVRRKMHTALMISIAIATLLAVTVTPVQGQVAENKTFRLDVSDVPAGDADATLEITLTNTSQNQSLGSANVTVPSPLDVVNVTDDPGGPSVDVGESNSQVVELRDLNLAPGDPGESFAVLVTVNVQRCTEGESEEFEATAKQSNTYLGTGNDFFLDEAESDLTSGILGTCSLEFVDQPADAAREATITSAPYDDQGDPITVVILDASTDPQRATHSTATVDLTAQNPHVTADDIVLGGTTSADAVAGFATFDPGPTLAPSAFEYTLVATPDFAAQSAAMSDEFDILDSVVKCIAGQKCEAMVQRRNQRITARFDEGPTDDTLVVALGPPGIAEFTCENSSDGASQGLVFMPDGAGDREGLISYAFVGSRPIKEYEICWAAPYPFEPEGELAIINDVEKPDGTVAPELYVGELPDCANRGEPSIHCVERRSFENTTSTVTIDITTSNEDPWMRH